MTFNDASTIPPILIDGVPSDFNSFTSNRKFYNIQKGSLNKLKIRPQIINEHAESSKIIQDVVAAGNIVGQFFKASHDNINGIGVTLESAAGVDIDDFESYADSAALQAVWVETGALALLNTVIFESGAKSMQLPLTNLNDQWEDTVGATDYTDYTFDLDFRQSRIFSQAKVAFYIGDGVNTKSIQLAINDINVFEHFEINENVMADDGGTPDITAITEIGFRVDDNAVTHNAYVDNLIATPPPGQIEFKLWDFGTELPATGAVALDDGAQYENLGDLGINGGGVATSIILDLVGGKRLYNIAGFVAGVALEYPLTNVVLDVDNYYAITIHYVDTDVSVYGPDSSIGGDYYTNGYAFTAPDESTNITWVGENEDIMFQIFSTQDVYINTLVKIFNDAPGDDATESVYTEGMDMQIVDIMVGETKPVQAINAFFNSAPAFLPKGGKFEVYYNAGLDSVTAADVLMGYKFKKIEVNG